MVIVPSLAHGDVVFLCYFPVCALAGTIRKYKGIITLIAWLAIFCDCFMVWDRLAAIAMAVWSWVSGGDGVKMWSTIPYNTVPCHTIPNLITPNHTVPKGDQLMDECNITTKLLQFAGGLHKLTWPRIWSSKRVCWVSRDICDKNAVNGVSWGKKGHFLASNIRSASLVSIYEAVFPDY